MAVKDRTDLTTEANVIKNETVANRNTQLRVGTMLINLIDSLLTLLDDSANFLSKTLTPNQTVVSQVIFNKFVGTAGNVETFAASLSIDGSLPNEQEVLVTSNITSLTLINKRSPSTLRIYLIQDAGGGNTIAAPGETFGTMTTNSVSDFVTGGDARNIIDVAISPSGLTQWSLETVEP